ncbi:hypothetical protein [Streptomonospora salina]|uniref:Uncharacterized protein n=1 Tax=Streptomonospora salina TaxID=104205 RepID=A0A841EF62_9ACTN|nr:hypothetical protein [Streptomonospora salina]MBB5999693.1 hypothetical protein [Streptomonospora salina]
MNSPSDPRPHGRSLPASGVHSRLLAEPYAAAAPYLRIILTGDPSELGTDKLAYSVNPQLTALLCYRTDPRTYEAAVLDHRHARAWGVAKQDLWFAAMGNLAHEPVDLQSFPAGADTPVNIVHGIGWPGSAHVMRLVDVAREPLPYGAVVMLPSPNTMLYAVLRSKRSVALIPFLYRTFHSLLQDGGPVTDQIIWWRNGRVTGMGTRPDPGGGVGISQTPEFSRLLDHELPD